MPALGVIVGGEHERIGGTAAVRRRRVRLGRVQRDRRRPRVERRVVDGAAWHALGAGLADLAEEMVVIDDVLWIGGPFTAAGGRRDFHR